MNASIQVKRGRQECMDKTTEMDILIEKRKKSESTKQYLYRNLRKNIIYNRLKPGDFISEKNIAEVFAVSRTPIREAIGILVGEELLEVYPQRGTYVSKINMKRVREASFMRKLLEVEAAKKACEEFEKEDLFLLDCNVNQQKFCLENNKLQEVLELDNQFHQIIFSKSGLKRVWQCMQGISADQERIRYLKLKDKFQWDRVLEEHYKIIEYLKEKDSVRIETAMENHITKIYGDAEIIRQKYPEYFEE